VSSGDILRSHMSRNTGKYVTGLFLHIKLVWNHKIKSKSWYLELLRNTTLFSFIQNLLFCSCIKVDLILDEMSVVSVDCRGIGELLSRYPAPFRYWGEKINARVCYWCQESLWLGDICLEELGMDGRVILKWMVK
jgi:hypothetical protein